MSQEQIVLPRVTDTGFENPEMPDVWPVVFRTGREELVIQSSQEEIKTFAKLLEASLRRSCDPTSVVLPTVCDDLGRGFLKGTVVKFYFPSAIEWYVFLVDTDDYSRVEVRLSRTADATSTVRLSRNQQLRIASR